MKNGFKYFHSKMIERIKFTLLHVNWLIISKLMKILNEYTDTNQTQSI